ncbi:exodeoxyribonuclease V subunit beta [Thauera sp. CAU 1555]|uniref:RecBCD enzyme subunit RecB n=1 Tax=Thauera sedimentorum TaxID=2767595 RepID=A0ABR9BCC9_9RHOO|nr:exodeoxyribonuclease V subunit beta [Thauera sedimentorum]MBC9073080.1 exodeoxyribonuclease V subunit beta [Thauera sedimentorum]MBD8503999.1 exodeoxyribonuclease V subunit beta [Thauera sedimentorum]
MSAPDLAPDVFAYPLDGIRLIEASAGTGKTWSICGLYLRLLLEGGLTVDRVLVVTFTKAATAELSARIRARIVDTLRVLDGGDPGPDPFVPRLIAVSAAAGIDPATMAERLRHALQVFDEAAIFTIHGFCQRALADTPFAAGLPYALELVEDDSALRREVAEDFWRRRVAGAALPAALARLLVGSGDCPEKWADYLRADMARPLATRLWDETAAASSPDEAETALRRAFAALDGTQLPAALAMLNGPAVKLHKGSYKPETVATAAAQWSAWLASGDPLHPLPAAKERKLHLLAAATLADKSTGGAAPPAHPFFDAADTLLAARSALEEATAAARLALLRDFLAECAEDLRTRKRAQRQIAFDDILWNAHRALTGDDQPWLAAALHARYPAALIDEFQDTDPLQFAIFSRVYDRPGARGSLFLVGDPKQAIYSFRSADLFAYLAAREQADARYTLAHNQRSTPALIDACNRLFAANPAVFMLPGLDYAAVLPGGRQRAPLIDRTPSGSDPAALRLWQIPALAQAPDERLPRAQALARAAEASAAEIARLLAAAAAGELRIGERPLAPGDIAVLVRSHRQGSRMRRALAALGVGSVELAQMSVFHGEDAEELERVLLAIAEPTRPARVLAALSTTAMGRDAAALAALAADEAALPAVLERFARWRELWLARGFGVMLRRWMADEGVAARLLVRPDGERRLTNLMHLAELLQQDAGAAAPEALLRLLATRRAESGGGEAAQLRLESDRNLVQIVTIHRAKGLEYGVVFCPFLFDGYARRGGDGELRAWHDEAGELLLDYRRALDPADKAEIDTRLRLEAAAEDLRLIYVALTRAIHRCYLVVGCYATLSFGKPGYSESTRSLLNWMVAGQGSAPADWFAAKPGVEAVEAAWQGLAAASAAHSEGPSISLAALPEGAGQALPASLDATRRPQALTPPPIPPGWRVGSFSALVSGARHDEAARDHDAHARPVAPEAMAGQAPPADDILRFPRGPVAGDCIHAVFERIDFRDPAGWDAAIAGALADHPQRAGEAAVLPRMLRAMLHDVLATELAPGLRLDRVAPARRAVELGFHLPAPQLCAEALNAWLAAHRYPAPRLAFGDLTGYLKGYIDLVFEHDGRYWVLDWKSNHLGERMQDYAPPALAGAMAAHGYHLQQLLYTVAVHRHLRRTLADYDYERHFGGVLYLFVRGVRPHWQTDGVPAGVFRHRAEAAVIDALDRLLAGEPTLQPA